MVAVELPFLSNNTFLLKLESETNSNLINMNDKFVVGYKDNSLYIISNLINK